jgi:hypothetical protein
VSTTARTPFTTVATVYSNSNRGLESARPLKTMVPGSTTLQSHQQGFTHTPSPVGSLVPISIGGKIRINDETSVVTEINNSALYKQDKKDHKKEQEERMRDLKDYVHNSLFPFWNFFPIKILDVGVPALGVCKLVVLVLCVAELLRAAVPELYTEDICLPGRAVIP